MMCVLTYLLLTVLTFEAGVSAPVDADVDALLTEPVPSADGKPHHLFVGRCRPEDALLHSETIVVNNDSTSRIAGDIRVNVEAPVYISCVKVLDQSGNASGAYPHHVAGGVGHSYVTLGFSSAYGYGLNFLVELYGHDIPLNTLRDTGNDLIKN